MRQPRDIFTFGSNKDLCSLCTMASIKISFVLVIFCLFVATAVSIKKPNFKLTSRIVNGFDANRNQFPYFAALIKEEKDVDCGGSVISNWHILTAAHCVVKFKNSPRSIKVELGKHLYAAEDGVIVAEIEKIVIHPSFEKVYSHNDIALLKMVDKIEFSTSVQPIALPQSNVDSDVGQRAILCGFGVLNNVSKIECCYFFIFLIKLILN